MNAPQTPQAVTAARQATRTATAPRSPSTLKTRRTAQAWAAIEPYALCYFESDGDVEQAIADARADIGLLFAQRGELASTLAMLVAAVELRSPVIVSVIAKARERLANLPDVMSALEATTAATATTATTATQEA